MRWTWSIGGTAARAMSRSAEHEGTWMPPPSVRGLTLIEVLVVIGIVAILGLMAVPALEEKLVRDQVIAAVPLAEVAKPPIAIAWAATQTFPVDNAAAGLPVADKIVSNYISSVAIASGAIDMTFGNSASAALRGKILTIRPAVVTDAPIVPPTWLCGHASTPAKMVPIGVDKTDIPAAFLPLNCRAG